MPGFIEDEPFSKHDRMTRLRYRRCLRVHYSIPLQVSNGYTLLLVNPLTELDLRLV